MAIEIVDLPIKYGGSFIVILVYQTHRIHVYGIYIYIC